jgi:hypothetical protein
VAVARTTLADEHADGHASPYDRVDTRAHRDAAAHSCANSVAALSGRPHRHPP